MSQDRPLIKKNSEKLSKAVLAVRCHDITTSLDGREVGDFDGLLILGMAVRLALHLRGVQAVSYDLLRQIALHLLKIPTTTLKAVIEVLAEVAFVKIDKEGKTIKSIVPTVPYYEDLFEGIGEFAENQTLSEPEQLTVTLVERLSKSPTPKESLHNLGAEAKLVNRMVEIGTQGGYFTEKRSRGRSMVLTPIYFYENPDRFADLAAESSSSDVSTVVSALSKNQGWPLSLAQKSKRIGETPLTVNQIKIVTALAGDGFTPPPAIKTSHAGSNFFLFGPKPGLPRQYATKRCVYEAAIALVAAVRQGQLLPNKHAIRSPLLLLNALKERKFLKANTEAMEQYRKLVILRLGQLVPSGGGWARFELIDTKENLEAVDLALTLLSGGEQLPAADDEIILAFQNGVEYLDPLVGRQNLVKIHPIKLDQETQREIDNLLFKGMP
jgi:hypothetical protein